MNIKDKIPNCFTLMNLSIGILSIFCVLLNDYYDAAILILIAALFDRFDGKLARKLDAVTEIGKQLDSLSDLISFGVAPTILVWSSQLQNTGFFGIIVAILYSVAGAYRLARYNTIEFDGVYIGIPITLAGGLVSLVTLYSMENKLNSSMIIAMLLLFSYLMISTKVKLKKR